ncbi:hypothetical protein AUC68_05595 [Methyloceanibacter methanicus]|uniref:Lysozyme inhibitor LprI N-terminal domain-containing protein n=1 Tax=Methyloceanibacter methanicus TaxID=1774968 RepID=A0A1E3W0Y1_9HYPH|nr:hypothetical protein AUC68_05595 [Methyloceanibacter methanicus]
MLIVAWLLSLSVLSANADPEDGPDRLEAANKVIKKKSEELRTRCLENPDIYLPSDAPDYLQGELYERFCWCYGVNSARMGMAELIRKGADGVKSVRTADRYAHAKCYQQAVELGKQQ